VARVQYTRGHLPDVPGRGPDRGRQL